MQSLQVLQRLSKNHWVILLVVWSTQITWFWGISVLVHTDPLTSISDLSCFFLKATESKLRKSTASFCLNSELGFATNLWTRDSTWGALLSWVLNLTCCSCSLGIWYVAPLLNPLRRQEGIRVSGSTIKHLEIVPTAVPCYWHSEHFMLRLHSV